MPEHPFTEWAEEKRRKGEKITFKDAMAKWDEILAPDYEAVERCTQLSAADYEVLGRIRWKI